MKKILIIPANKLPIPPTMGGAVETLITNGTIEMNEIENKFELTVLSVYEEEAEKQAKQHKNTKIIFYKHSLFSRFLDSLLKFLLKITRRKRLMSLAYSFRTLWFIRYIKRFLKKNDFDEVVIENSMPVLRAFKSKKIYEKYEGHYWYHAHAEFKSDYGAKKAYEGLRGIIGVSQYICDRYDGVKDHRNPPTYLLQNYADHDVFKPIEHNPETRKEFGLKDSDFVVLFVGRLDETKGIDKLIEAFKKVVEQKPDNKLLVVGANFFKSGLISPFEKKLRESSESIKDNIVFTGYVDHSRMAEIYSIADVVCLPSVWQEPGALTVFESMACGKALVTTKSGGIPEYVGDSGIVLPIDEHLVENIASNILRLEDNPEERESLEKSTLERSKLFSKEKYYKDFVKIVLKSNGSRV